MKTNLAENVAEVNARIYNGSSNEEYSFEEDLSHALQQEYGLTEKGSMKCLYFAKLYGDLSNKMGFTENAEFLANIVAIKPVEQPYVLGIQCYSGYYTKRFKHLQQVQMEFSKHKIMPYYEDGSNYGVYYYKENKNGTKELLDYVKLDAWFNLDGLFSAESINNLK